LDDIKKDLSAGKSNPRDLKRQLAREIVQIYHDKDAAQKAESDFDALFIKKDIPDDIPEYALSSTETLVSIMVGNELVSSNGDAKRMIKQGAVKLDDEKISDMFFEVSPDSEKVLKVGKRKFLRITV
jgi:tyrosyl-tRNA synthetase